MVELSSTFAYDRTFDSLVSYGISRWHLFEEICHSATKPQVVNERDVEMALREMEEESLVELSDHHFDYQTKVKLVPQL